jgi:ribosome-associated heat shock protein Hsp15
VSEPDRVRVDVWLVAARFFKTRGLAAEAITAGRVAVNGERAKPSRLVKAGDELAVRRPPFEHTLIVRAIASRRGPATEAQKLYEESDDSRARREAVAAELKSLPPPVFKGRPTKRDRRTLNRFLTRQSDNATD